MPLEAFRKSPKQSLLPGQELRQLKARIKVLEMQEELRLQGPILDSNGVSQIPIGLLSPNPRASRRCVNEDFVSRLAKSIERFGLINPIVVRVHPGKSGYYQIIVGGLRWRAVKKLGRESISAFVIQATDDQMATFSLSENCERAPYTAGELKVAMHSARMPSAD